MIKKTLKASEHTIVFVGDFNPTIFHPAWFSNNELISNLEAEKAEIKVIHNEISEFSTPWLNFQSTRDRYVISTVQEPYYEVLRDLGIGTFSILRHVPIRQLGINLVQFFSFEDQIRWHEFGHFLAPKHMWRKVLNDPGLVSLAIRGPRDEKEQGYFQVNINSNTEYVNGVRVMVNCHFEISKKDNPIGSATKSIENLSKEWENSMQKSQNIIENLFNEFENEYTNK